MKSFIAFFTICILWSFSWFVVKYQISTYGISILVNLFYRFFGTAILTIILIFITKTKIKIRSKKEFYLILFVSFILTFFYFLTISVSFLFGPSWFVSTISCTSIFFSEFIISAYDKKKSNPVIMLTSITGMIGMFIMFKHDIFSQNSISFISFLIIFFLGLLSSAAFAVSGAMISIYSRNNKFHPLSFLFYCSIFQSIFILIAIYVKGDKFLFSFDCGYVLIILYVVIFVSTISYISMFYLNTTIGPAKANYTSLVYIPLTVFVSAFFENLTLRPEILIGTAILVVSVFFGLSAKGCNNKSY